jgi:alpha-glucoside transport system permease protein
MLAWAQRFVLYAILAAIAIYALNWSFGVIREEEAPKLAVMLVALTVGIGGAWAVIWLADRLVAHPNPQAAEGLQPYVCRTGDPAPAGIPDHPPYTTHISFFGARSEQFVGLKIISLHLPSLTCRSPSATTCSGSSS